MSIYPKSDAIVVGMGPVGAAAACTFKILNPHLNVLALEKREDPTRHHSLFIQSDSIQRLVQSLELAKIATPNQIALISELKSWENRAIPTTYIQDKLTQFAEKLGVQIFKGDEHNIDDEKSLDLLLEETGAKVVIGADGAHSKIRQLIGATLVGELTLSYLLELKYKVPEHVYPRDFFTKFSQASAAEGFDFETAGSKVGPDGKKTFSLHKFIDQKTHEQLKKQIGDIEKGTSAHPWNIRELKELSEDKSRNRAKLICEHLEKYLQDHGINENVYSEEKIVTFPLKLYQSSSAASNYKGRIVLLAGDANSGLVLERGVNKGFIESALCIEAVSQFFRRSPLSGLAHNRFKLETLPIEFQAYQRKSQNLFSLESRWARLKFYGITAGEFVLKTAVRPFKWIYKNVSSCLIPSKIGV